MADELDDAELSVSLSELKLTARGRAYEDLRPIMKTGAATLTNVMQVLENAVGVSCDFANYHLKRLRIRYQEGVGKIPEGFRELPPFRLGCNVVREAVFAAEEPELQELFAQLLLTGSDSRTQKNAYPGFATTIGQLSWYDAQMLNHLRANRWQVPMSDILRFNDGEKDITEIVFYNLRRLGLVDWWYVEPNPFFPDRAARNFAHKVDSASSSRSIGDFGLIELNLAKGLEGATREFSQEIMELLKNTQTPFGIRMTPYGQMFVGACCAELPLTATPIEN